MKKIGWIKIASKKYGGVIYGERVRKVLAEYFDVELKNIEAKYFKWRYLKPFEWFFKLIRLKEKKDLWVRDDFFSMITFPLDKTRGKNLFLHHHIDFSVFPLLLRSIFYLLEKIFYHNLKKVDIIVTVSEYWRNYFISRGYPKVYKIYNGFDLSNFDIGKKEVLEFKKKYKLEDKPIIYLGNCQKAKGVVENYRALKNLDVHLITSGRSQIKIPARNLEIEYEDYLKLLKASSIVLVMSKFKEGWCRTAHEAMLCRTPVVGSGCGGMRELLEGGKQVICEDFQNLKEKVEYLLNHSEIREKMGEDGYNFAKNFTLERFKKEWINLVNKIL